MMGTIDPAHQYQLDENGFVVLNRLMDTAFLEELRRRVEDLFEVEGEHAGSEFKQEAGARRLANLVDKGQVFERVISHPVLLEYVKAVLGPKIKLSSLNARSAMPGISKRQPLHADMAAVADEHGYWVCNSVWLLSDFTAENGALRVVPRTHRRRMLPQDELRDPSASHPEEATVTGEAGSVIIMNAHLWHGGLENKTRLPRTAVHAFYTRRDKPQQQYQKKLLRAELQASFSPLLRDLLALDDEQNDQLSANVQVRSGFLK